MRIALLVEYDGSQYHGWQSQPGLRTVQHALEQAINNVDDKASGVICAGRTDTGVHATNQVIHFDTEKTHTMRAWLHGTNSFLPKDVRVKWGQEMPAEFHARYSAIARSYQYIIYNSPIRPALLRGKVTWQYRPLDHQLMHAAGQMLIGEQDFTSFRSIECQSKTPMRNIHSLQISRRGDLVIMDISANAFLHHMVRNIAGLLIAVGAKRKEASSVQEILLAKDRKLGAETAPPYGLYLVAAIYPPEMRMPKAPPISVLPWEN